MSLLLQLNATANWGSTGKIAEGIGLAAMSRGWESVIGYGRYVNPSRSKLIKVGSMLDVYAHYARNRFLGGEGLGSRRATYGLIKRIKELQPDIIHLHNIHDHWLNYPILFEYLATINTPIVWTFHDCWAFTGGCAHFEAMGCNKWMSECCDCPLQKRLQLDKSRSNFLRRKQLFGKLVDRMTIVCVSNWLATYVRQSILKDCRIEILNNGIDLGTFSVTNTKKHRMVLGVSNKWYDAKGLPDFVMLRKLLPDDVKMVLVGLTQKQIKQLPNGITGIIRTGSVETLANLYREAAVFVNPTHNDSFPTVNLEALACGTPVITYRTGGSPEAIDEHTGMVVEKGDVKGLAEAIMGVINNPERFSAKDCVDRVNSHFNQDVQFAKYVDLYEDLLGR